MLDKRRSRKMNGILSGLGDLDFGGAPQDFGNDASLDPWTTEPGFDGSVPDQPIDPWTTEPGFDAPVAPVADPSLMDSIDLTKINKILTVGSQAYRYVRATNAQGKTVARAVPVRKTSTVGAGASLSQLTQAKWFKPLLIGAALYFLLT